MKGEHRGGGDEGAGILFVISAPSGAGKTTLSGMALSRIPGLKHSVSCTTRPIRPGEVNGTSYDFVSREKFLEMANGGKFIEWVELHGHMYGTPNESVAKAKEGRYDLLLVIDVQGAERIRRKNLDTVLIFILPPSIAALEERLGKRGTETPASIVRRIDEAKREMERGRDYDYLVVNGDMETAADELECIIRAERCRLTRRSPDYREFFPKH